MRQELPLWSLSFGRKGLHIPSGISVGETFEHTAQLQSITKCACYVFNWSFIHCSRLLCYAWAGLLLLFDGCSGLVHRSGNRWNSASFSSHGQEFMPCFKKKVCSAQKKNKFDMRLVANDTAGWCEFTHT